LPSGAFPGACIQGPVIRIGRWSIVYADGRLDLTMTPGASGWHVDGCDEAMVTWTTLVEVLGG
jgi:hypothetical protein